MMNNVYTLIAVAGVLVVACVDRPLAGDTSGAGGMSTTGLEGGGQTSGAPTSSGSSDGGSTLPDTVGGTGIVTGDGTSGSTRPGTTADTDTCGFICESSSEGPTMTACDVYEQDCPEGEKCAPYAEGGGGSWNAVKCVPVTGDGQPGEPCVAPEGGVSGIDDCAKGMYCWDIDEMGAGRCIEMCSGSEAAPICKTTDTFCSITSEGVLNVCLPDCDPLIQDCQGDDLCIPIGDDFVCVVDASGDEGQAFDPCEFANACDKGLLCLDITAATECDPNAAGGCCSPFCDLTAADFVCPGVGQGCLSLYAEGQAPPEFENVGGCVLPE